MAKAKTANMIEWAQGQMIYEMTERVERAERGPKHGRGKEGRHIRVGPGPENVFDYRKDREGPSMAKRGPKHGRGKEGRYIQVGPGPENVFDYRKDREGPSMAKRGPKHGRGKEGRHNQVGPGPENVCDYRKDREGPGMVKAKTAEVIEWAQGQRIYEITERIERAQAWPRQGGPTYSRPENLFDNRKAREGPGMVKARTAEVIERANGERIYRMTKMIERAQAWPRQGGPRPKIKWGPYFRELLYGSINHDEALTRPRLIYTEDLEGQDDLQDDRGGLGPAVSWGRGAEIQGGGLLGKDYWMVRYTRIMDYRPDVIIDCD
ncbi:hypothetical protein L210DRAFT_3506474 [Boletus edulis BED1]|uniref:Uncharacterized protein n=1 Tax=Boletus edulis BED1 TaxID=1328754 RepID=A0AAD4BM98_BOLED|nr:hypothetical protein L210DRAFT_3506474 [Boletus edulis BED1]